MNKTTVEAIAYICITLYTIAVVLLWVFVVFVLDNSGWWTILFILLLTARFKWNPDDEGKSSIG